LTGYSQRPPNRAPAAAASWCAVGLGAAMIIMISSIIDGRKMAKPGLPDFR
jgi:hypothetical protein